jgi:hypothetical protein
MDHMTDADKMLQADQAQIAEAKALLHRVSQHVRDMAIGGAPDFFVVDAAGIMRDAMIACGWVEAMELCATCLQSPEVECGHSQAD